MGLTMLPYIVNTIKTWVIPYTLTISAKTIAPVFSAMLGSRIILCVERLII